MANPALPLAGDLAPATLPSLTPTAQQQATGLRGLRDCVSHVYKTVTTGGTAPAYTAANDAPITTLAAGLRFRLRIHANALAPSTLAVDGLTATAIKVYTHDGQKADAALMAGQVVDVEYDGTHWVQVGAVINDSAQNLLINPDMGVSQRNGTTDTLLTATGDIYTLDRWRIKQTVGSKLSVQQDVTDYPAGFRSSLKVSTAAAYTTTSTDAFELVQPVEGINCQQLALGTVSAQYIAISFWVKSSLIGAYGIAVRNGAGNRCYMTTYTINAANTWGYKTIVAFVGDTSGAWAVDNTVGLELVFDLGGGTGRNSAATAVWQTGNYARTSASKRLVSTAGAVWRMTGARLSVSAMPRPCAPPDVATEMLKCLRYYERSTETATQMLNVYIMIPFRSRKRSVPTITAPGASVSGGSYTGLGGFRVENASTIDFNWTADAEL